MHRQGSIWFTKLHNFGKTVPRYVSVVFPEGSVFLVLLFRAVVCFAFSLFENAHFCILFTFFADFRSYFQLWSKLCPSGRAVPGYQPPCWRPGLSRARPPP